MAAAYENKMMKEIIPSGKYGTYTVLELTQAVDDPWRVLGKLKGADTDHLRAFAV